MSISANVIIFTCLIACFTCVQAFGQPTGERGRRSIAPLPQQPDPQSKGNVNVDIHRERGVGTVVSGQAERKIYQSPNGNTRVDVNGHWSRVYDGPARGQRNHGAGIRFSHRW